ncbi:MAG TPA: DUF6268 family outer membrane beta-barrel protein [Polyangiales bacterium]|nr:DUF6268 family outer membrane beta-barrel protein [Polyangiales bacterium]
MDIRGGKVGFQVFKGLLSLPIPLGQRTHLIPLLGYEHIRVDTSGETLGHDGNLHAATFGLSLAHRFNDRWTGIVGGTTGPASNVAGELSSHDLFWTLNALALYTSSPAFTFGFGGSYDQRLGMPLPVPLLSLRWEPTGKFSIRGTAPSALYVSVRPLRALTLQLTASLGGQRYHLSNREYDGTDTRLAYSLVKLGGGTRIHFGEKVHLELLAGYLVARRFEKIVDDDSQGKDFLPPGAFFGGSLWFGQGGWTRPFEAPR